MIKSYLRLAKEFQTRSFDAMTAHTAIVLTRYTLLSIENRENKDGRSFGGLFYACCKELDDITFEYALALIIEALQNWLEDRLCLEETCLGELVGQFIASLPIYVKDRMTLSMCES